MCPDKPHYYGHRKRLRERFVKNGLEGFADYEVVDDTMADLLRSKTPAERIRIGFDLWTSTRNMLLVHLRKTHPEWSDEKIKQEAARRLSHGAI